MPIPLSDAAAAVVSGVVITSRIDLSLSVAVVTTLLFIKRTADRVRPFTLR